MPDQLSLQQVGVPHGGHVDVRALQGVATLLSNTTDTSSRINYVLISGSYKENADNDTLCRMLGERLSQMQVGVMSGAGNPGRIVSRSFHHHLSVENKYHPERIIFYVRKKARALPAEMEHTGTVKLHGEQPLEMRKRMLSKSSAIIIVGGQEGTKQEEQLASIHDIPVIPIARTGKAAYELWQTKMEQPFVWTDRFDRKTFELLNDRKINIAVDAAISLLERSIINWVPRQI
jgi:predicted Rossmann-fold nucleotide-binding protein